MAFQKNGLITSVRFFNGQTMSEPPSNGQAHF